MTRSGHIDLLNAGLDVIAFDSSIEAGDARTIMQPVLDRLVKGNQPPDEVLQPALKTALRLMSEFSP